MVRARGNVRLKPQAEPAGLWHQPALMSLVADLLIVLAVAGLAWTALTALQRLPVFPLRELVLTQAPRQVSAAQIEHAARSAVVGNFFTVDLDAARSAFERLPWVRKASLRRQWPNGLLLDLEEHEAVARWRHPGAARGEEGGLVNRQGEVFDADLPAAQAALPLLSGPEGSSAELLQRRTEFDAALAGIGRHVVAVSLSPRHAWRLRLDDGTVLELGRDREAHPLAERLARFVNAYENVNGQFGQMRIADMRYPNGFVASGLVVGNRGSRS
jgi:cell division protein FtsQ